jgi:hypothetical protein
MKTNVISAILVTVSLGALGAMAVNAQTSYPGVGTPTPSAATMAQNNRAMVNEPNYVLAMAYHESMCAFADALNGQTVGGGAVDVDFARAAVVEMRRSFDQMKKYNEEYMETISAEVRAQSATTMQTLETQRADLNAQLTLLETEVKLDKPDAKKVATLAAGVHTQLDAMMTMNQGSSSTGMTMKH